MQDLIPKKIVVKMTVAEGENLLNAHRKNKLRRTLRRGCELEGLTVSEIWIGEA